MKQKFGLQLAAPLLALMFALFVSGVILQLTDNNPGDVLRTIINEGFEVRPMVETLNRAAPYYIAGVAVAIGFKMTLFNIGVEGQYRLAALLAAWVGASVNLPAPLHIALILVVAIAVGALWGFIPGMLRATRGVSEVISSIMLNAIALGIAAWLLSRWFRAPASEFPGSVGTYPLPASARLPNLNSALTQIGIDLPPGTRLQSYLFVAIAVGIAYRLIIWRTRFGFDLRASGSNTEAAAASGVDPKRMMMAAMALSGGAAGLIGLNEIMSNVGNQARFSDLSVVSGLGFTGIAIALLGRNNPVGIAFAAILWAFMDALQTPLSSAELPKQITEILQGITVLSVVIAYELVRRIEARREAASLRQGDPEPPDVGDLASEVAPA